jgi:ABC-type polar amino acid transport system ATPase subunit
MNLKILVLDKVGMKEYSNKMPHQISGGEQQRVAIMSCSMIPDLSLPMSHEI